MSAEIITSDGLRITVDRGRIAIRVLSETSESGARELLDKMGIFVKAVSKEVLNTDIMKRKIPNTTNQHEPDCIVLKLG
jgi:hypothetical protein